MSHLAELEELRFKIALLEEKAEAYDVLYAVASEYLILMDSWGLSMLTQAVEACEPFIPDQAREDLIDAVSRGYAANVLRRLAKTIELTKEQQIQLACFTQTVEDGGLNEQSPM